MQELSWHDIKYFLEVVQCGSVSKASKRLHVNQSTVSRRINTFEQTLKVKLFDRSAGAKWVVTAAGERLMASAERMADEVNTIQREILREASEMSGLVRLTFGNYSLNKILIPILKQFTDDYPGIDLEIITTDNMLNLAAREADIAIRVTNTPPDNLVGKRVGIIRAGIYGTHEMRTQYEAGNRNLPCISWLGDDPETHFWIKERVPHACKVIKTNSLHAAVGMAGAGMGLVYAPRMTCEATPKLHFITGTSSEERELWVLSHVDLRTTARVRLLRDHIVKALDKAFNAPISGPY